MRNSDQTVVISGGNRGIGEAITKAFWKEGCHILVGARTETHMLRELGERARFEKMDVRLEENHRRIVKTAFEWTGRLDVYVNCAGLSGWRPVEAIDLSFWDEIIDTNLKGTFWGCKVAAENLSTGGCIINISSLAGKRGSANNSVYCASKFGVNGLTQALAKELGPRGIRVNAVCPVYVQTDGLLEALMDKRSPTQGGDIESYLRRFAEENAALKRLPTGEEVAKMCVFLASDEASAITGQCINVDCGVLPQ